MGGEQVVIGEKESASKTFTRRIIATLFVLALAGIAYASSPLQKVSIRATLMQAAPPAAEASSDIPKIGQGNLSLEQAMFEGMDENKDSFLSKDEFDKFVKSESPDASLEGFRSMKFEDVDMNKDGKIYQKDFTYFLQTTKDSKILSAVKNAKASL